MARFDKNILKNIDTDWVEGKWNLEFEKSCGNLGRVLSDKDQLIVKSCYIPDDLTPTTAELEQKRFIIESDILKCLQDLRDKTTKINGLNYITEFSGEFDDNNQRFIFTPFYKGGTLGDNLRKLSNKKLLDVTKKVLIAIDTLEKLHINHRDLHVNNIVLDGSGIRIIDFDTAFHESIKYRLDDDNEAFQMSNFTGDPVIDKFFIGLDINLFIFSLNSAANEIEYEVWEERVNGKDVKDPPIITYAKKLFDFYSDLIDEYDGISAELFLKMFPKKL